MNNQIRFQNAIEAIENPSNEMLAYIKFRSENIDVIANSGNYGDDVYEGVYRKMQDLASALSGAEYEFLDRIIDSLIKENAGE